MYQPISAANFPMPIMIIEGILVCCILGFFWDALKNKNRTSVKIGSVSLILMIALFPFINVAFEKDAANHAAMEDNIMIKFNDKFSQTVNPYLKNVEYLGDGEKYESGHYFNLTYGDESTQRIKFFFSDKTGEPRCFCENIRSPQDVADEIKKTNDAKNKSLFVYDRTVMIASDSLNQDLYKLQRQYFKNSQIRADGTINQIIESSKKISPMYKTTDEFFTQLDEEIKSLSRSKSTEEEKLAAASALKIVEEHRGRYSKI